MSSSSPTDRTSSTLSERIGSMFAKARHRYSSPTGLADISLARECKLTNGTSWRKPARTDTLISVPADSGRRAHEQVNSDCCEANLSLTRAVRAHVLFYQATSLYEVWASAPVLGRA